jgi:hypothetical protein
LDLVFRDGELGVDNDDDDDDDDETVAVRDNEVDGVPELDVVDCLGEVFTELDF